ncbi:MAG: PIN domain-containing protein [Thiohalocapsa sp.]
MRAGFAFVASADMLWHMLLVLDTDVIVAGVMSASGTSRMLLETVGVGALQAAASVPLFLEYESVLKREETLRRAGATVDHIDAILDQLASMLVRVEIWYLWRPQLRGRDDDMVLEAAANAGATHIVSFNLQDLGLSTPTPPRAESFCKDDHITPRS